MREARVYFLRPIGAEGPVKIGHSYWPNDRLRTYQHWSPLPLEIAATILGPQALERRFHARFYHLHSHHEWFFADPSLTEAIDAIRAGTFDVSSLPRGRNLFIGGEAARVHSCAWNSLRARLTWMIKKGVPLPPEVVAAAGYHPNENPTERSRRRELICNFFAAHDTRMQAA